jgi:hypothetical protein
VARPIKIAGRRRLVLKCDPERSFDLGRRFDLVVCLEVAEHLSADAADQFIASLTRHVPMILFSAAIPFQGGHHHVNERFLPYWMERFARFDFRPLNVIRGKIWDDPNILWWLRQNAVHFVERKLIDSDRRLQDAAEDSAAFPFSVVHPDVNMDRVRRGCAGNSGNQPRARARCQTVYPRQSKAAAFASRYFHPTSSYGIRQWQT